MKYLYGDSTPSPLTYNFIELLRDALDFSVSVLVADGRISECHATATREAQDGDEEIRRLRAMEAAVAHCIDETPKGDAGSATGAGAEAILRSVAETVRAQEAAVHREVAVSLEALEAAEAVEREGCLSALQRLLVGHELPSSATTLRLALQPSGTYAATVDASTPYGLSSRVALDVPAGHAFAHVVRLEKLTAQLEVHAPESAGWIRKEVKLRPQRLDRFYVTELSIDADAMRVVLRADDVGKGAGYDVTVRRDEPRVTFVRLAEEDAGAEPPVEMSADDTAKLVALGDALTAATADLPRSRRALLHAALDGIPFREHRRLSVIVDRLVGAIAETTEEIARRSLTPTELVLKRLVSGDRREEIFVSKSSLLEKLAPLTEAARERFAPLGLAVVPAAPSSLPHGLEVAPARLSGPPPLRPSDALVTPPAPPSSRPTARMGTTPPPYAADAATLTEDDASETLVAAARRRDGSASSTSSSDFLSIEILTTEPIALHDEPTVIIDENATP